MRISEQIFPRVCALVCTKNKNGKDNVMTISFLMPVSFNPKIIAFSISPQRESFKNLKEIPEFTLNILSKEMKEKAEICGSFSGKNVNKFEKANLEKENSEKISPPLIKNCPISFECQVLEIKEFGDHFLIVGKIIREIVRKKEFSPLLHKSGDIFMEIDILK